jgi:hypothetical protein
MSVPYTSSRAASGGREIDLFALVARFERRVESSPDD